MLSCFFSGSKNMYYLVQFRIYKWLSSNCDFIFGYQNVVMVIIWVQSFNFVLRSFFLISGCNMGDQTLWWEWFFLIDYNFIRVTIKKKLARCVWRCSSFFPCSSFVTFLLSSGILCLREEWVLIFGWFHFLSFI
jgi:hypothetical protein